MSAVILARSGKSAQQPERIGCCYERPVSAGRVIVAMSGHTPEETITLITPVTEKESNKAQRQVTLSTNCPTARTRPSQPVRWKRRIHSAAPIKRQNSENKRRGATTTRTFSRRKRETRISSGRSGIFIDPFNQLRAQKNGHSFCILLGITFLFHFRFMAVFIVRPPALDFISLY